MKMSIYKKLLFSASCCVILANIYYAQPILSAIAADLGLEQSVSGMIVSLTQAGYCLGVLLLVPLGDSLENKKLVLILVLCATGALLLGSFSRSVPMFFLSTFLVGASSCAVQIILPMGIGLASEKERGGFAGMMMAGAILGIVLSRPVASLITDLAGWRAVYLTAACMTALLVVLMSRHFPRKFSSQERLSYMEILRSMVRLMSTVTGLWPRLFIMFSVFAAFTMFWSTAPLYLREAGFSHTDIALLSLTSLIAPLCALLAGQMVDRGLGYQTVMVSTAMMATAFLLPFGLGTCSFMMIVMILMLEPGAHMTNVVTQQTVLLQNAEARSRLNALCICFNISGGALGACLGPWLYIRTNWNVVVAVGGFLGAVGFLLNWYANRLQSE